jgi:hypothetical protein
MRLERPALGSFPMRLVLRRFVTPRKRGIEIALWSRSRTRPLVDPEIRRCLRLFARVRARSREQQAALEE